MTRTQMEQWPREMKVEDAINGRQRLGRYQGRVTLMLFGARETAAQIRKLAERIIERIGHNPEVTAMTVINIAAVPKLFHPMAMAAAQKIAANQKRRTLRIARDQGVPLPEDELVINPFIIDADGKLTQALAEGSPTQAPQLTVLDPDGFIRGRFQGLEAAEPAVELIWNLIRKQKDAG